MLCWLPRCRRTAAGSPTACTGMDHAGAVAGPLVAAGLLAAGLERAQVILWTIVPGVLSVLLVAMREPGGLAVGNGKIEW